MKRLVVIFAVLLALAGCMSAAPEVAPTALPEEATAAPVPATVAATNTVSIAVTETSTALPVATPTLDPTIARPDTPTPPETPIPTATPGPSGFAPAAPVAGFDDGLVLIPDDGSVIVYTPDSGRVETLFGPNTYLMGSFDGPDPIWMPPRLSPDGRRLLLPRIGDTWLAERAAPDANAAQATAGPLMAERLWATWAPDGQRIVFTANSLAAGSDNPGAVYVLDVVAGGEPQVLTELPAEAPQTVFWPIWSSNCGSPVDTTGGCGRMIAALGAGEDGGWAVWVIDSETGESRQLGSFRPPAVGLLDWLRWPSDGTGLIAYADSSFVFFPLDGGAPRPLVVELATASFTIYPSPDGTRYARLDYTEAESGRLMIGQMATGEETMVPGEYERIIFEGWTSDSRFAVISAEVDGVGGLYAIDTAGWPEVGEPVFLATDAYMLGLEWQMAQQATVVDPRPWATTGPPLPAGPVETWTRHEWPAAGLQVAAPAGWRFEAFGPYADAVLANYDATSHGLVALSDEQLRVDLNWRYALSGDLPPLTVEGVQSTYFQHNVEAVEIGGVTGARLTDTVTPLCEQLAFPHHDGQRLGELWLTYCPATEQWRAFMTEFVGQLGLGE